jgi:hypothetical protein
MAAAPVDVDAHLRAQVLNACPPDPARQEHYKCAITAQLVTHPLGTATGEKRRLDHHRALTSKRATALQRVVNEMKAIREMNAEISMLEVLQPVERSERERKAVIANQRARMQAQIAVLQMQMPPRPTRSMLAAASAPALPAPAPPAPIAAPVAPTINVVTAPTRNRESKLINGFLVPPTPPSSPTGDDGEDLAESVAHDEADLRRAGNEYDYNDGFLVDETAMETDG